MTMGEIYLFANRPRSIVVRSASVTFFATLVSVIWFAADGSERTHVDEPLDPSALLQQIKNKGARDVYYKELLTDVNWPKFLNHVETGDRTWLQVAVAIYPATDGGPATELHLAVGVALVPNPREALLLTANVMHIKGICDYSELTMADRGLTDKRRVTADIDARINAVRKLSGSDVALLQTKCLEILENAKREMLGPNGPFSSKN